MTKTLTEKAYAKINLYLAVTGKRDDGYHNIDSVMQTVSLHDTVTVTIDDGEGQNISITSSHPDVPCDARNIAAKCAAAFFADRNITSYNVTIDIDKKIPVAGGLAGGSTDGAAVLKILNKLCGTGLGDDELCRIGGTKGADIPFCIRGGTQLCEGTGTLLTPIDITDPTYTVLIVSPGGGVSTPEAYGKIDSLPPFTRKITSSEILAQLKDGKTPRYTENDFEKVILPVNPNAALLKKTLLSLGADLSMMSGSGPTVYALFENEKTAEKAAEKIKDMGFVPYLCKAISPSIQERT